MRRFDSGEPVAVGGDRHRVAHVVEVVERLAHAHQHDVGDLAHRAASGTERGRRPAAPRRASRRAIARQQDLADDLLGLQVAHQPLRAGVAERAGERAADLARDAQRAAVGLGDVDGLDLGRARLVPARGSRSSHLRVPSTETCSVTISRPLERVGCRERGAQVLGDVRHGIERGGAARVDPAPQLADAHVELLVRHADGGQRSLQLRAAEAREGRLGGAGRRSGGDVGGILHGGPESLDRPLFSLLTQTKRARLSCRGLSPVSSHPRALELAARWIPATPAFAGMTAGMIAMSVTEHLRSMPPFERAAGRPAGAVPAPLVRFPATARPPLRPPPRTAPSRRDAPRGARPCRSWPAWRGAAPRRGRRVVSRVMAPTARVISFTVASESTAQCETSSARAPA